MRQKTMAVLLAGAAAWWCATETARAQDNLTPVPFVHTTVDDFSKGVHDNTHAAVGGSDGDVKLAMRRNVSSWSAMPDYPYAHIWTSPFVVGNRLFVTGGRHSTFNAVNSAQIYFMDLNSDGTAASGWKRNPTDFPTSFYSHQVVYVNGFAYSFGGYIGGTSSTNVSNAIYRAPLEYDGTLGPWSQVIDPGTGGQLLMQETREGHRAVYHKGEIYVIGGARRSPSLLYHQTIERYRITPNGGLEFKGWDNAAPVLPAAIWEFGAVAACDGIYVMGGYNGGNLNNVRRLRINTDGSITGFVDEPSLPTAQRYFQAIGGYGMVWAVGGFGSAAQNTAYRNLLGNNPDGAAQNLLLTPWASDPVLPATRYVHSVARYENNIYAIGGLVGGAYSPSVTRGTLVLDGSGATANCGTYEAAPLAFGNNKNLNALRWGRTTAAGYTEELAARRVQSATPTLWDNYGSYTTASAIGVGTALHFGYRMRLRTDNVGTQNQFVGIVFGAASNGSVTLDRSSYACPGSPCGNSITITVVDEDVTAVNVLVRSTTESAGEVISVPVFPGAGSRAFRISVPLTNNPPAGDGMLSVKDGDIITVEYTDAFDGVATTTIQKFATATVHCQPLQISDVLVRFTGPHAATVRWNTNYPTDSQLAWGPYGGVLSNSVTDSRLKTNHELVVQGVSPCGSFGFTLAGSDAGCNTVVDNNNGNTYGFATRNVLERKFYESFEVPSPSWTATGLWNYVTKGVSACADAFRGKSAWHYGVNTKCTFNNGATNSGVISSPAISLSGMTGAVLSFRHWLETEDAPASFDRAFVQASSDGATFVNLNSVGFNNTNGWEERYYDVSSYAGGTLYVRFSFNTQDGGANDYRGWYVDDVAVWTRGTAACVNLENFTFTQCGLTNSQVDAGETLTFTLTFRNEGNSSANSVGATLQSLTPHAAITSAFASWAAIPAGSSVSSSAFQAVVSLTAPCTGTLPFAVRLDYDDGVPRTRFVFFNVRMGTYQGSMSNAVIQTFDTGALPSGWSVVDGFADAKTWSFPGDACGRNLFPTAYALVDPLCSGALRSDEHLTSTTVSVTSSDRIFADFAYAFTEDRSNERLILDARSSVTNNLWVPVAEIPDTINRGTFRADVSRQTTRASNAQLRWRYESSGRGGYVGVDNVRLVRQFTICGEGVCGPYAKYQSHSVSDCPITSTSNCNAILTPGETTDIPVNIRNIGSVSLTDVSAYLSTTTPGVTIVNNYASYPNMTPQITYAPNAPAHRVQLDGSVPCGSTINFVLDIYSNEGSWSYSFTATVESSASCITSDYFFEDVENGVNGWTLQNIYYTGEAAPVDVNLWHRTTNACPPGSYSGITSWYFGQDATCTFNYSNQRVAGRLVSPEIVNLPAGASLDFRYRRQAECPGDPGCNWDRSYVQISLNGGPFTDLFRLVNGDNVWNFYGPIDLSAYAGQNVRVAFHFDSMDGGVNDLLGWMVDDIRVSYCAPVCAIGTLLQYKSSYVDDCATGNCDGVLQPGETALLPVTLKNAGPTTATGVFAYLSTGTPGVSILDDYADYPNVPGYGSAQSLAPHYQVQIDPSVPCGTVITFYLSIFSNEGGWTYPTFTTQVDAGTLALPIQVAILNDAGYPSYFAGGNQNDWANYQNILNADPEARFTVTVVTELSAATIAPFDVILLPDNAVPDANLVDVETWFNSEKKTIVAVDSAISYAAYSGFMWSGAKGTHGMDTYWDYNSQGGLTQVIGAENYITRAYAVGQIISAIGGDAQMFEWMFDTDTTHLTYNSTDASKKYVAYRNVPGTGSRIVVLGPYAANPSSDLFNLIRDAAASGSFDCGGGGGGPACSADAYEPDDTCSTAAVIYGWQTQSRNFCDDPEDWIEFNACGGRNYEIYTSNMGPMANAWFEIYAPACGGWVSGAYTWVNWTAPSDGVYLLRVYQNDWTFGPDREYDITLNGDTSACPGSLWSRQYGDGNGTEFVSRMTHTADGGFLVAGGTWGYGAVNGDGWLMKTDGTGTNIEWQNRYGDSGWDYFRDVAQSTDGGYGAVGQTNSFGAGLHDIWVAKVNSWGGTQWQIVLGGANWDYGYAIRATPDGGFVVAGSTQSFGAGGTDAWIIKLDQWGNVEWQYTYGFPGWEGIGDITLTDDGGYVFAGQTDYWTGDSQPWVVKLNASGTVVWQNVYSGFEAYSDVHSVQKTPDGGYAVTVRESQSYPSNLVLLKLFGNGGFDWAMRYPGLGGNSDEPTPRVLLRPTGGFALTSDRWWSEMFLLLTDTGGYPESLRIYNPGADEFYAHHVVNTSDGGYALLARGSMWQNSGYNVWIARVNEWGDMGACPVGSDGVSFANAWPTVNSPGISVMSPGYSTVWPSNGTGTWAGVVTSCDSGGGGCALPEGAADFWHDAPKCSNNQPINFNAMNAGFTYEWDFDGNGQWDANGQNVSYSYPWPGTYMAKLRVTDAAGCFDETTQTVEIYALPSALFTHDAPKANSDQPIYFNVVNYDGNFNYEWDFTNDGFNDALGGSVSFTYPGPGWYDCKLAVTNSTTGCANIRIEPIYIAPDTCILGSWPIWIDPTFAPAARSDHATMWAPELNQMLVWGGRDNTGIYFNDGAAYDPAGNSWTFMAASPLTARSQHAGAWTGALMIVWGGETSAGRVNDGARYNPGGGTWTMLSAAPLAERSDPMAVWTGSEMIIWGGQGNWDEGCQCSVVFNDGARYNPATNMWTPMSPSPLSGRSNAVAVWTGTHFIVWGGVAEDDGPGQTTVFNDGAAYDPATDTWTMLPAAPLSGRGYLPSVWTGTEIIMWGGYDGVTPMFGDGARFAPGATPSTGTWTMMSPGPGKRGAHTAVWTGTRMLVWGGVDFLPGFTDFNNYATGASYNPATDNWVGISPIGAPQGRFFHGAVWAGNVNRMVVWGGNYISGAGGDGVLGDGGQYAPGCPCLSATASVGTATVCQGTPQTYTATATGGASPFTYAWDFSYDGVTFNAEGFGNPISYTQPVAGFYTVRVRITDSCGSGAQTAYADVSVTVNANPVAAFTSTTPDCLGQATAFTNASTGAASYQWDFSYDGVTFNNESTATNPTFTYLAAGTYTVRLRATSTAGCNNFVNGTVVIEAAPVAAFTSTTPDCLGQTTTFTNTSTGADAYAWDFSYDGVTFNVESTSTSPTFTYGAAGTYTVRLRATKTSTGCQSFVNNSVVIEANPATPTISGNTSRCANDACTTLTSSAATSYLWSPGGATTQSICVSPAATTTYTVTVTNAAGCSATSAGHTLTVNANPAPTITESACGVPTAGNVTLDAGAGAGWTYLWSPSGQTTQTIVVPGDGASYTVTVTVSGCQGSDGHTTQICGGGGDPPGEVANAGWQDTDTLTWDATAGADSYNIYRGDIGMLPEAGNCQGEVFSGTSWTETESPFAGATWFYLVNGQNGTGHGTLGTDSDGAERTPAVACP